MIAEFGWPSAGYNLRNADPGPFQQAATLRNFVTKAQSIGMEYNIVEAIDQPWKFFEGGVGPYWGILNADREPKFSWTGPVVDEAYWKLAGIALLIGVLLSLAHSAGLPAHGDAGPAPFGSRQRRRCLGRDGLLLLDRPLLRFRFGLRTHAWSDSAGAADPDCDGAHWEIATVAFGRAPAAVDYKRSHRRTGHHRHFTAHGLHSRARVFRAARDAQADARCGRAPRLSEFRMRRHH